jgi:hypothetical protein
VHSNSGDASNHLDFVTDFDRTDGVDDAHDAGLLAILVSLVSLVVLVTLDVLVSLVVAVVGEPTRAIWDDGAERPAIEPDANRPVALPAPLDR